MGNMHVTLFIVFPLTQMHDFSENLQVFLGVYGFQAYGFLGKNVSNREAMLPYAWNARMYVKFGEQPGFPAFLCFKKVSPDCLR